ncbi:hypothetical protein JW916_15225 [Candidatus Sumerlaeota bacterium]|nr:hypothetical protein [Candidatus Sumerlaeota bacterium]
MARRRTRSTARSASSPRRVFSVGRLLLWIVLIVETLWLGGFIWSTGSWIPPGLRGGLQGDGRGATPDRSAGWSQEKQDQLDELQIQQILQSEGAEGESSPASSRP